MEPFAPMKTFALNAARPTRVLADAVALALTSAVALAQTSCVTSPPAPDQPTRADSNQSGLKGVETKDLNRTADPCTDFYEFTTGTWRAQNPIPASQPKWGRRAVERETNKRQLQSLLEELSAKTDWPSGSVEQQVGDYYASCMDEAGIESKGLTPLAPLIAGIDAVRTPADVQRLIRRLHDLAIPVAFGTTGDLDYHEPLNFIATLVAGSLGLPDRDSYLKSEPGYAEARARYKVHLVNLLELGGMPAAQSSKAAEAVFALEKRLSESSLDSAAAADPAATDHKLTFAQLEQLAPGFEWDRYVDEAKLSRGDLNVAELKLIQQVDKELKETPVADWKAFLLAQLLDSASPWLSKAFAQEFLDFKEKAGGATEPKLRGLRCLESTDALLGEPLAKKYVERYFPPAAKAKAQEISHALLAELKAAVPGLSWMAPETKKKALEKLDAYNPQLGYPDQWKDYSSVVIRRDAFWENIAATRRFGVDDNRRQVGKPSDRNRWALAPSSPAAYLDLQLNEIVLPAGFLRPPAFSLEVSDAANYGAIGAGLAHDMTHSIDAAPPQLDLLGRPINWWTAADLNEFQKRGQCLVDQYDGYFIEPGLHQDGKRVLNESIGDLAGVRLAYLALEKSLQRHPVPVIDGFTPEQQFFIAYGQLRGEAIRLEAQRQMVKTDTHPVPKFRVNGPLLNLPEFQQAFSCKASAEMVRPPDKRCAVW